MEDQATGDGGGRTDSALTPRRSVVDGVTVFSLDVPGPLHAELIFRVGVVDELLPTHGITHLIEHLAMSTLIRDFSARDRINAQVDPWHTRFGITGDAGEIVQFCAEVTRSLHTAPVDSLEKERLILRTEAANKQRGSVKANWVWRFGANGLGLVDYEEFGLRWLGADHVAQWAAANFTAANAVMWISGTVPENLRLDLPAGERKVLPDLRPLALKTPGVYEHGDRWVALTMLCPRTTPLWLGGHVLNRRIRDRLRHEQSLAYDANAIYQRIGRSTAEISCFADSLFANSDQAANALVEVVRKLADEGPTPDEIAGINAEVKRSREHPAAGLGQLEAAAIREVDGSETKTVDEVEAERESMMPDQVAGALREVLPSALLAVPQKVRVMIPGFDAVPMSTGARIQGIEVRAMPGANHADVIHFSTDGISLTLPNQTVIGMRWDEVNVAMWWNDGRRSLVSAEGGGINVHPEKWKDVQPLMYAIQHNVPADRWVPMDEPGSVPRAAGPICSVCQSAPAAEVTFQNPRSLWLIRMGRVHGILCRDCGTAKFREIQRRVLLRGWWSVPGLGVTPIALIANTVVYYRLIRRLAPPIHTSGIAPLRKGRTVWLAPGMLVPLAVVLLLAWIFWPR